MSHFLEPRYSPCCYCGAFDHLSVKCPNRTPTTYLSDAVQHPSMSELEQIERLLAANDGEPWVWEPNSGLVSHPCGTAYIGIVCNSECLGDVICSEHAAFAPDGPVAKLVERVKELEGRFTHKQETLAGLEARGYDNPGAKVLCHKWLDWECVDNGCQSLFLKEAREELLMTRKSYAECLADWQRASAELEALRKLSEGQLIELANYLAEHSDAGDVARFTLRNTEALLLKKDAELEALRKLTTPQPIETAPRDGTLFLGYSPAFGWRECLWNAAERGWWRDNVAREGGYERNTVTHWLPIPQAPEVKE